MQTYNLKENNADYVVNCHNFAAFAYKNKTKSI